MRVRLGVGCSVLLGAVDVSNSSEEAQHAKQEQENSHQEKDPMQTK